MATGSRFSLSLPSRRRPGRTVARMLEQRRTHGFIWVAAALLVIAAGYRLLADRAPAPPHL